MNTNPFGAQQTTGKQAGKRTAGSCVPVCLWLLTTLLAAAPSHAADSGLQLVRRAHYIMGTVFEIEAYGEDSAPTGTAI